MTNTPNLERIRSVFERSGVALSLADAEAPDCPLVLANPKFEDLTGYRLRECEGRNCRFLQEPDAAGNEPAKAEIRAAIASRGECQVILRNQRKDGTPFSNLLFLHPVGAQGRYILGSQFEIDEAAADTVTEGARRHAGVLMADLERIGAVSARLQMQGRRHLADAAAAMVMAWSRRM
ncbi:PAS domain-containing protein [Pseudooceanicola sp.]|uniref:PAS domain-containing protein n=1 Tax=Pseudooceanicola sp. TaxID=1914328 RepID=UPI004059653B